MSTIFPKNTDGPLMGRLRNDGQLHMMVESGYSMERIITVQSLRIEELLKRVVALDSIRPRKIVKDGVAYVWHCPNELIPEEL